MPVPACCEPLTGTSSGYLIPHINIPIGESEAEEGQVTLWHNRSSTLSKHRWAGRSLQTTSRLAASTAQRKPRLKPPRWRPPLPSVRVQASHLDDHHQGRDRIKRGQASAEIIDLGHGATSIGSDERDETFPEFRDDDVSGSGNRLQYCDRQRLPMG